MAKLHIKDESGDRKYFTIIPNYIANHSTANDQSLYFQMKRYAGENGECFASEKLLCNKLGIGRKALKKSIDYLLEHGWIKFIGLKQTNTKGGMQPIKNYSIVDIWQMNNEFYKGVSERALHETKGVSERAVGGVQKNTKGVSERAIEEEPRLRRTINKNQLATQSVAGNEINTLIQLFEPVNPSYEKLFSNKTQRAALERLVKKHGMEKIHATLEAIPKIIVQRFAPRITTPLQLEDKLGELIAFYNQKKSSLPTIAKIR